MRRPTMRLVAVLAVVTPVIVLATADGSTAVVGVPADGSTGATGVLVDGSTGVVRLPACPATKLRLAGAQTTAVSQPAADGTWDLRGAVWHHVAPEPVMYPVESEQWTRGCIVGARVVGGVPRSLTRDQWFDGKQGGPRMGGEAFRQTFTSSPGNYLLLRNTYVSDYEDAYDPNAANPTDTLYLDHVRAEYIRDDCIENEGIGSEQVLMSVVVRNSLFDGCFVGFAQRPLRANDGRRNGTGPHRLVVDHSLMYIQPQRLGPKYCSTEETSLGRCRATADPQVWLGSYGIWKWSGAAASRVVVRNSIFRLDMPSYISCKSQDWPAGTYRNVVLVWAGKGRYRSAGRCVNTLPRGVRLTTNVRVWRRAKTAWLAGRPWDTTPRTVTHLSLEARDQQVSGTLRTAAGR